LLRGNRRRPWAFNAFCKLLNQPPKTIWGILQELNREFLGKVPPRLPADANVVIDDHFAAEQTCFYDHSAGWLESQRRVDETFRTLKEVQDFWWAKVSDCLGTPPSGNGEFPCIFAPFDFGP
jgi:hypothetical protein